MGVLLSTIRADLQEVHARYAKPAAVTVLTNRGFHALLAYRLSKALRRLRVPLAPLLLTRAVQIFYGIDLDPDADIAGGVVIIHGMGVVVGYGATVGRGVVMYHGVTLGMKCAGRHDGFPNVGADCSLGAGAKLLGPIVVGGGSVIGANVVLTRSVPPGSLVKVPLPVITTLVAMTPAGPAGEGSARP